MLDAFSRTRDVLSLAHLTTLLLPHIVLYKKWLIKLSF